MNKAIQEAVKMSPIDTKKRLYANIVSVDSNTFKRAQVQYFPFEAEALGIVWLLNKEDYFTHCTKEIVIFHFVWAAL